MKLGFHFPKSLSKNWISSYPCFFFRKILVRSLIELETWSFFQNVAYTYIMAGGNWFYACISKGSCLKWLGKFCMKIIWAEIGWKKYSIKLKFLSLISTLTNYLFAKFQVPKSFILSLIETCHYFASHFWCSFGLNNIANFCLIDIKICTLLYIDLMKLCLKYEILRL